MVAAGRMRRGSAASVCRSFATGCCASTPADRTGWSMGSHRAHPRSSTPITAAHWRRLLRPARSRRSTAACVRWRRKDLARWLLETFAISLDETTVGRELTQALGFAKISARPRHYAQNELAVEAAPARACLFHDPLEQKTCSLPRRASVAKTASVPCGASPTVARRTAQRVEGPAAALALVSARRPRAIPRDGGTAPSGRSAVRTAPGLVHSQASCDRGLRCLATRYRPDKPRAASRRVRARQPARRRKPLPRRTGTGIQFTN